MKNSRISVPLLTLSLFSQILFYGYNIISGRHYGGASSDNSFISFTLVVDIIPVLLFIGYCFSNASKKRVLPILIVLFTLLVGLLIEGEGKLYTTVKAFIAFSIPSSLIGILLAKYRLGSLFAKWLEPLVIFLSWVGISSMSVIMMVSILDAGEEGIGIQSLAYYCAFAFSLNLYYLLFGEEISQRFKYAKLPLYKLLSIALLVVQVVVTLSSGGRGGFVLLSVSAIILVFMRLLVRRKSTKRVNSSTPALIPFLLLIVVSVIAIVYMPESIGRVIGEGSERTFSYLSTEGIDMEQTSNRDIVYGHAIKDIINQPVIGYGLLMKGTYIEGSWPHNIILEILLQGGIFYLILFFALIIGVISKLRRMIKSGHELFIIPILLYPTVMLCFSGSYLSTGLFWFAMTYILCYEIPKEMAS